MADAPEDRRLDALVDLEEEPLELGGGQHRSKHFRTHRAEAPDDLFEILRDGVAVSCACETLTCARVRVRGYQIVVVNADRSAADGIVGEREDGKCVLVTQPAL